MSGGYIFLKKQRKQEAGPMTGRKKKRRVKRNEETKPTLINII